MDARETALLVSLLATLASAAAAGEAESLRASGVPQAFPSLIGSFEVAPPPDAELASHYAPTLYHDIHSRFPRSIGDLPLRFDYDRDWIGSNNWENLHRVIAWQRHGEIAPGAGNPLGFDLGAYVYFSVVESARHWFITYAVFHPQDWSDDFLRTSGSQHENDMEGAMLTIEKDGSRFGKPIALQTQAHGHFFLYSAAAAIRPKAASAGRGTIIFDGSRPRVYIECEGHGIAAGREQRNVRYGRTWPLPQRMTGIYLGPGGPSEDFGARDGLIFAEGAEAEYAWDPAAERDAKDPARRTVGYRLLPLAELWDRRASPETMMRFETYRGSRFAGSVALGFAFNDGRKGEANPPWGWAGEALRPGDLFFDPAWSVGRHFDFSAYPGGFDPLPDGRYARNPYLDAIGARFLGAR